MVEVVDFEPRFAEVFKTLNESWISKFFKIEEEDVKALANPQAIIDKGGAILVALYNAKAVGVCALKKMSEEQYEFSKFAVEETKQGLGIGNRLMKAAIEKAKTMGAKSLYLESNRKLDSSIHLYRKFGFNELNLADHNSPFERADIIMELALN